ncbi:MAG TPA: SRPBCC domain-containing protein [Euzebyales bacterium]|nr:SRPBCC domain-containing protein [Euzebyales bacterium]
MSDTPQPHITRTVDLDATVDEVWTALTDDRERAAWFGGAGRIDIRPGGTGKVVEPDGSVHRVRVGTVEPGRRLGWRWSPVGGGAEADVEFVVEELPRGARLTVTERRVAPAAGPQASAAPSVTGRLLDLELLFLARSRV